MTSAQHDVEENDVSVATGAGPLTAAAVVLPELIEELKGNCRR